MAEEEKVPEYIKKFHKMEKKISKVAATREHELEGGYRAGLDAIKDEKGEVDLEKLDTSEGQDKFLKGIGDHYITKAKQALNAKGDHKFENKEDEEAYNAQLMQAYAGITKEQLQKILKVYGSKFKEYHDRHKEAHIDELKKNLRPLSEKHIEDKPEHLEGVVKYTKSGDFVHADRLRKEDAVGLLRTYNEGKGAITHEMVKKDHYAKKTAD